ncbi:MAG: DUF1080 domain-containing protein [Thermoguttaceae bacterium]
MVKARANLIAAVLATALLGSVAAQAADRPQNGWYVLSQDLKAWQEPTGQWFTAGGAQIDPKNRRRLVGEPVALEFMIPENSNSGVKLEGVYEVQIFDSWKVAKPKGEDCGGIYPRAELTPTYHHIDDGIAPLKNAAKQPGRWQTLEIVFRAPRFDAHGGKIASARFDKVVLNGILIHDHVEVRYPTGHIWRQRETARGPLLLQADHGPVAFRNVRVRPLPAK